MSLLLRLLAGAPPATSAPTAPTRRRLYPQGVRRRAACFGPPPFAPPIRFVRGNFTTQDGSSTTITAAFTSNGAGDLITASVGWLDPAGTITVTSVTDTAGNTYFTAAPKIRNATQQFSIQTFYAWGINASAGTNTVTFTFSAAATFRRAAVEEWTSTTGPWTSDPFDKTSAATGNSANLNSGAVTPAVDYELIYGWGASGAGTLTAAGLFFLREPPGGGSSAAAVDLIQGAAASIAATETTSSSSQWVMQVATFRDSGPPFFPQPLTHHRIYPPALARRNRSRSVTPTVVAAAAPSFVPQPAHVRCRPALARRRPVTAATPPPAQVSVWQAVRARLRLPRQARGHSAQVVPPQIVLVALTYPPAPVRTRLRGLLKARPRAVSPIPAQVVPPPAYVPARVRSALARMVGLRRPHSSSPLESAPMPPPSSRIRSRLARIVRGHVGQVVPPQVILTAPTWPPPNVRTRLRGIRPARGHAYAPVPDQVAAPAPPAYVAGRARQAALKFAALRRGHTTTAPAVQAVPLPAARRKVKPVRAFRGRSTVLSAPPQATPPLLARLRVRLSKFLRRPTTPSIPVPAQVILIAPPYPPASVRGGRKLRSFRRRRGQLDGWFVIEVDDCPPPTTMPDTGVTAYDRTTTARPTGSTARPTGTTARTVSTTARPTGVTVRTVGGTARPTGTTGRPGTGVTTSDTGVTVRPDTGDTQICD